MSISEYNECVYSFSDAIYRFILKQIKNEEEAKDIVQESYEKLWKNKHKSYSP
jgi:RNA polymerase sigma-70 factor (ECF subfamily)